MDKNFRLVYSFAVSAIFAAVFIAASTIGAELYAPFKNFLANNFWHHWIGKSVISFAIFAAGGVLCYLFPHRIFIPLSDRRLIGAIWVLSGAAVLGIFAIFGFFVYEYLAH